MLKNKVVSTVLCLIIIALMFFAIGTYQDYTRPHADNSTWVNGQCVSGDCLK